MPPSKKNQKNNITKFHQPKIWQRELKRPPSEAVASASIRMKETCDDPSGFCDLLISDACQCPHLTRWLPNMLDLNHVFCKNTSSGSKSSSLVLADPVHALHMTSQLEENSTYSESIPSNAKTSPWLYGEEQQRTVAFAQSGIASGFFPIQTHHIFHQFNALNPDAPKALHAAPRSPTTKSKASPITSSPTKKDSSNNKAPMSSPVPSETGEPVTKKPKVESTEKASSPTKNTTSVSFASPVASVKEIEEAKSTDADQKEQKKDALPGDAKKDDKEDAEMKDVEKQKEEEKADGKDYAAGDVDRKDTEDADKKNSSETESKKETEDSKDVEMKDADRSKVEKKQEDGSESKVEPEKKELSEDEKKTDLADAKTSHDKEKGDDKEESSQSKEKAEEKGENKDSNEALREGKNSGASALKEESTKDEEKVDSKKSDSPTQQEQSSSSEGKKAEDEASKEAKEDSSKKADANESEGSPDGKQNEKPTPLPTSPSDPKDKKTTPTPSSPSTGTSATSSPTKAASEGGAPANAKPDLLLSDARFLEISRKEEQIKTIRKLLAKRVANTKKHSKKRKLQPEQLSRQQSLLQRLPGSLQFKEERPLIERGKKEHEAWMKEKVAANRQVEVWLEQFRASRRAYWKEQAKIKQDRSANSKPKVSINFSEWSTTDTWQRTCKLCPKSKQTLVGDEIMQCLDCPFIGCSPVSIAPNSRNQHILQHLFLSGHKFAVTCGARADIFCFPCGDFVFHKLFDQERDRLDLEAQIPWLSWSDHPLQRSFDPLQFAQVEEYGILWRGLMATYPPLVPQEHYDASKLCLLRQSIFEGRVRETDWIFMGRRALDFAIHQNKTDQEERYRIPFPIGMYNLGNTCFMSSILQCLIHCPPFQRYFLKDMGHHHKACKMYRSDKFKDSVENVCLACEMDSLMLDYYSRSTGRNVLATLNDLSAAPRRSIMDLLNEISTKDEEIIERGEPIVITRMLTVAWKSSGMGHLAGYEQRDAHEFLQAFLDILGRQICKYRAKVDASIALARAGSRFKKEQEPVHHDVIKHLFEGKLRSVLVCQDCGTKRTLSEVFLNISLPLLKEIVASHNLPGSHGAGKLSLDRCLQHFTHPETLADPVDCPACKKKTTTKKQHTFSKLPKVLCVHLKRFHAALNKKIEDFVSFPAKGLNMGSHLPHWREVTTVPDKSSSENPQSTEPEIYYDLFGTVNHHGNLQSGHYTTNVLIGQEWFRCNDQHVSKSTEATVLTNDGAYILFYRRR